MISCRSMLRRVSPIAVVAFIAFTAVGCQQNVVVPPALSSSAASQSAASRSVLAPLVIQDKAPQHLYVAAGYDVLVFPLGARGDVAPERDLHTGSFSYQIAVGPDGSVYTVPYPGGHVAIYSPGASGNAKPSRLIYGSRPNLDHALGIAVDGRGFVYVGNAGRRRVEVFPPGAHGNVYPARTIVGSKTELAGGANYLDADEAGNLFVQQGNGWTAKPANVEDRTLIEFAPHAHGDVWPVAYFGPAPARAQSKNISTFASRLVVCAFTGDQFGGIVDIYQLPSLKLIQTLAYAPWQRGAVMSAAISREGYLYVLFQKPRKSAIDVFAPSDTIRGGFRTKPAWILEGPLTGLSHYSESATDIRFGP